MPRLLPIVLVLSLFALAGCGGSSVPASNGSGSTTPPPVTTPPVTTPTNNPAPTLGGVTPQSVVAGAPTTTITLTGTNFISASSVALNGTAIKATYVSATSLQAEIPAESLASGQESSVMVSNPTPGGGSSGALKFSVMAPTPVVSSLSPSTVPQGVAVTMTVTGSGFEANSVVLYNGSQRPTTFVNSTTLRVQLTAQDVSAFGSGEISVFNPGPGSSTTTPSQFVIASTTPKITGYSPASIVVNATATAPVTISITGSGFAANSTVQANGQSLTILSQTSTQISASLPTTFFASTGTVTLVVTNPGSPTVQSNTIAIPVVPVSLTLTISPNAVAAGSPDTKLTVTGTNFFADSVVKWNDTSLATTFVNARQLTAIIPASMISGFAQAMIRVDTPETAGQAQPPSQPFTTYLALATNDIVYNAFDGLIYASIPGSVTGGLGNTISAIDPATGTITKSIFVGSEPTRISLSSDGKKMWVGLNGAASARQVDLVANTAGTQFYLGGGSGIYNPPYTVQDLATLPGQPDSVAVYSNNGIVTIYDSGVARTKTSSGLNIYFNQNYGSLSFDGSSSTLYLNSQSTGTYIYALTVDGTGITAAKSLPVSVNQYIGGNTLQYDNGRLYLPTGAVVDAVQGSQVGQFSVASSSSQTAVVPALGPIVSESAVNRAWMLPGNLNSSYPQTWSQIIAYDETTFNPIGTIPVTGVTLTNSSSNPQDMIRWGQNGLAFRTNAGQLFVLQSPLVKDLSTSPAEVAVTINAPAGATTGSQTTYTLQVNNAGPSTATGVVLTTFLPAGIIDASFNASQGACTGSQTLYCNLGSIASGSSANLTITFKPTSAGALSLSGFIDSISFDPNSSNNQATASISVTGNAYNAAPVVTQLTPSLIAAGSTSPTLTVVGAGFTAGSSILWNGQAIPTTYVGLNQLSAVLDSSLVSQLGWAQIAVSTPAPGGGQSAPVSLHIYKMLDLPANAISYDAYTRKLYSVLPSTSKAIAGNSILAVDPFTGSVGSPIQVGSEPNALSETSDGQYMYISLSGAKSLGRFNLKNQALDLTVPITITSSFSPPTSSTIAATSIATVPGSTNSLEIYPGSGIFDITGSTGKFRTNTHSGTNAFFSDATHFYSYDTQSTGAQFYRYLVTPQGPTMIDGTTLNGIGGFNGSFVYDRGTIIGGYGGVINPNTTPPSQLALMSVSADPTTTYGYTPTGLVSYLAESKAFFVAGSGQYNFLRRFDTTRYVLDQQVQLPFSYSTMTGVRFGQDGIAFLISNSVTYTSTAPPQIMLLRGPFVLPAEINSNPAPSLTSVSQSTITAGSANVLLTVNGSGFIAGASAVLNGTEHTTTWVNATQLQVAIPASELATAQSIELKVLNPGSGESNSLTVQVQ